MRFLFSSILWHVHWNSDRMEETSLPSPRVKSRRHSRRHSSQLGVDTPPSKQRSKGKKHKRSLSTSDSVEDDLSLRGIHTISDCYEFYQKSQVFYRALRQASFEQPGGTDSKIQEFGRCSKQAHLVIWSFLVRCDGVGKYSGLMKSWNSQCHEVWMMLYTAQSSTALTQVTGCLSG